MQFLMAVAANIFNKILDWFYSLIVKKKPIDTQEQKILHEATDPPNETQIEKDLNNGSF